MIYRISPRAPEVGLIGPNGCGKSTQLLMLMKQVSPGGGRTLGQPFPDEFCLLPSEGHYGMRDLQDVFCWASQLHMFYIPL